MFALFFILLWVSLFMVSVLMTSYVAMITNTTGHPDRPRQDFWLSVIFANIISFTVWSAAMAFNW